ncbi:hypothetical protein [Planctomycetes bacterium K23_9]|uniref:Shikimate dehydrogenase n=1 Tax=Stieleria marina TaxID=1930275 RepID=A0A517NMH5_9BACT|nr:hypothetical protein K239x_02730 [Planctomycetes bacterium K23_9]
MDGLTEPLIAVIGDPIAGNPSQFAIEFALKSLDLDFRVTSFHVQQENIVAALDGLQVLDFRGVLVDDSLSMLAAAWRQGESIEEYSGSPANCLSRSGGDQGDLIATDTHGQWLSEAIQAHFAQHGDPDKSCLWLGNRSKSFPSDIVDKEQITLSTRTPTVEAVTHANLIVLSTGPKGDVPLNVDEWPTGDGSKLIVDLTDGKEEICAAAEKGYRVISALDRQIGVVSKSFQLWTDAVPSTTIIQEAIEEYLSV